MDDDDMDLFWRAQHGLPRNAPGSEETLRLLLGLARPPAAPRIVDMGCGRGPATLALVRETGGTAVGVDLHEPFLAQLRADADAAALADRVTTLAVPMDAVPLPAGSVDLIWAEGSAYVIGFDTALARWRSLLAPGGALVLTEAEWTVARPSPEARAFWDAGYPGMRDTAGNGAAAVAAGWTVAATHLLPDSDWDAYYVPLAAHVAALRADGHAGPALDAIDDELRMRREHAREYGYRAYVLRPREDLSAGANGPGAALRDRRSAHS